MVTGVTKAQFKAPGNDDLFQNVYKNCISDFTLAREKKLYINI